VSNILPFTGTGDIWKNAPDEISLFITPNIYQLANGINSHTGPGSQGGTENTEKVFSDTRSARMLELPGRG
jgi:hypothetical protein